jgi:cytochrome c nitrite reductase small subunit
MRIALGAHMILGAALGAAVGTSGYTFLYAHGSSYLTDDPRACANCHIMRDHYDAWIKGSHRSVATCNDCHTPPGFFGKYTTKALNGFWHSFAFTTGRFPDPIRIKPRNHDVTERACRKCHADIVVAIDGPHGESGVLECIRCHGSAGHLQ